jgi:hypothetical protein
MMTDQELKIIEACHAGNVRAHYQSCHLDHPECAIFKLSDEIRRLWRFTGAVGRLAPGSWEGIHGKGIQGNSDAADNGCAE